MISTLILNNFTTLLISSIVAFLILFIIFIINFFDARVWDINGILLPGPKSNFFTPNLFESLKRNRSLKKAILGVCEEFVFPYYNQYDLIGTKFFNTNVVFCWDPEMIKVILSGNHNDYPKSRIYERIKFLFGQGLLTSEGEMWQLHRRIINPGFHFESLKNIINIFNKCCQNYIIQWKKLLENDQKIMISFDKEIPNLTLSIICESAFGIELSSLSNKEIFNSFGIITEEILLRLNDRYPWWHKLFPSRNKVTNNALKSIIDPFLEIVFERKKLRLNMTAVELNELTSNPKDLIDILLNSGDNLSINEIKDHTLTFFVAGFDTTSAAINWIFYELLRNKDVLLKCYEEVDRIFTKFNISEVDGLPYECINQLTYLNQVIKESMRLHPPAHSLARLSKVDTQLGTYKFKAGTVYAILIPALHRNPKYWENPNSFNPDRFASENQKKNHPFQYIPFSGGPRNCIGQRFALMEITVILSLLLRNFNISIDENDLNNVKYDEALVSHLKGLKIFLSKRA